MMNHDNATSTTEGDDAGDQQRWIDGLLRSSAAAELEAAPAVVRVAASAAITKFRRRQAIRRSLVGLAAAATLAAIMARPNKAPLPRREGPGAELGAPQVVQTPEARQAIENPSPSPSLRERGIEEATAPSATFVANGDAIAVPVASGAADVTIVQLYPTIAAERRWRRELALNSMSTQPNGG